MKTLPKITEQDLTFCEHYSIHRKPVDAFKFSRNCAAWSFEAIQAEAYNLLARPNIALKLYEIATSSDPNYKVSASRKKHWLSMIVESQLELVVCRKTGLQIFSGDPKVAIQAIAELNKMDGDLAAIKKEITGAIGITIDNDDLDL